MNRCPFHFVESGRGHFVFYYSKRNPVTEFLQARNCGGLDTPLFLTALLLAALFLADGLTGHLQQLLSHRLRS